MILLLAIRNLLRSWKNSFLILLLVAVVTILFFTGNSLISQSEQGLRRTYIENLTGDIVIQKKTDITMNLFGANTPVIDEFFSIPSLPAYMRILELIGRDKDVAAVTSQVSGKALLDAAGTRELAPLCGIDAESYFSLFPGIVLETGELLQKNRRGAMISAVRARRIEKRSGNKLSIGDPLLFTSVGMSGFKIREVPLTGIYSYKNPGQAMDEIVLIDPQTVRALSSILTSSSAEAPEEAADLLGGTGSIDDFFDSPAEEAPEVSRDEAGEGLSLSGLKDHLSRSRQNEPELWEGGDWNFILLRLKDGASPDSVMRRLNPLLSEYDAKAVGWRTAAGSSALLVLLIQSLFNAGVFLVGVAGIIAMVNIMLIAVFRRTREIGTLRAIGASDSYIRRLFLAENLLLSLTAGLFGIAGGWWLLHTVNGLNLAVSNQLIASLLGRSVLSVDFSFQVALEALVLASCLSVLASLYPVHAAVRIDPITAVRKG